MNTRKIICTLTLAAAVIGSACQPTPAGGCNSSVIPADGTMPCGVVAPDPDADGVVVVGDSITWGAAMAVPSPRPVYAYPGWRMGHALPFLRQLAVTHPDARPVLALGTNDTAPRNGGWNDADVAAWSEALALFPNARIVLPEIGQAPGQYGDPTHAAEAAEARAWMTAHTALTVPWPQAHDLTVVGLDSVHLAPATNPEPTNLSGVDPSAAQVRYAVIEQAVTL